jgi:hypothetical protein
MQISLYESNIIFFGSWTGSSYSGELEYSQINFSNTKSNGVLYDQIYIGDSYYYIPISFDSSKKYSDDPKFATCQDCDGILGFGMQSVFWKLWNGKITFARDFIQLGYPHYASKLKTKTGTISCNEDIDNFCAIDAYYQNINKGYTILLSSDLYNVYVPGSIYEDYVGGMNVYKNEISDWKNLKFHLPMKGDENTETKVIKLEIKPSSLISEHWNGKKELLLNSIESQSQYDTAINNENHLIFGLGIFQDFVIFKDHTENTVVLYSFDTTHHYSALNLVLFLSQYALFIRWKLTDPVLRINSLNENIYWGNGITVTLEFVGILCTVLIYVLPSTQRVLHEFTGIYISTTLELSVLIIVEVSSIVYVTALSKRPVNSNVGVDLPRRDVSSFFQINAIRNMCHDVILTTSLWLALLERTKVTLAIVPTVVINVYIFYNMCFFLYESYCIPFIEIMASTKSKKGEEFYTRFMILFCFGIFPPIFLYQTFLTYKYFLRAWINENATSLSDIDDQLCVGLMSLIFIIAVAMVVMYLKKYARDRIRRELKKEVENKDT